MKSTLVHDFALPRDNDLFIWKTMKRCNFKMRCPSSNKGLVFTNINDELQVLITNREKFNRCYDRQQLLVNCLLFSIKKKSFLWTNNVTAFAWRQSKYFGRNCCYNKVMVFEKRKRREKYSFGNNNICKRWLI